jgi:voltage-gated potassium channel
MSELDESEIKDPAFEIFVGVLSVLSIVNLLLLRFIDDEGLRTVLLVMNGLLSVVFLGDFAYRLRTTHSRSDYFLRQWGWADLLASLPIPSLKILRLFRLIRVWRLMRLYGARNIVRIVVKDRAGSALLSMILMGILVLQFGSLWMLALEQGKAGANVETASDAIWYVLVTMSTVGYGDQFPVTTQGRLLGAVIIIIGVGIFGTFTGYLANLFLAPKQPDAVEEEPSAPAPTEVPGAADELRQMRVLLERQQATLDALQRQLGERPA